MLILRRTRPKAEVENGSGEEELHASYWDYSRPQLVQLDLTACAVSSWARIRHTACW